MKPNLQIQNEGVKATGTAEVPWHEILDLQTLFSKPLV